MRKPVLVFRADADNKMGTGHLMRCTSLAGILADNFICRLVTSCAIPLLLKVAKEKFEEVIVVNESVDEEKFFDSYQESKLVVLDGYHFDKPYQEKLQSKGFKIAVIDDLIKQPIAADLIINHCGGLQPLDYHASASTVFGLGTAYLLLNPIFLVSESERRLTVNDSNCLICLGGADPHNNTSTVLKKVIASNAFNTIHVVIGAAFQHRNELDSLHKNQENIFVHQAISSTALKEVMLQCSFAVCSPSTIVQEYLSIGGIVWLKQIADNQKHIRRFLLEENLTYDFDGDELKISKDFSALFAMQSKYFDGKADERLKRLFTGWALSSTLQIRRADENDLMISYEWINDTEVRNQSYSSNPILLESHTDWFLKKIKANNCFYYILQLKDEAVGQIRFDVQDKQATISYLTGASLRNKGVGPWILAKGIQQFLSEIEVRQVIGHVKKSNIASLRSFEKLAFEKTESTVYTDSFTYTMTVHGNSN